MNSRSPTADSSVGSISDRNSSSPSLSLLPPEVFNRLQAFQVYLEMSGTIDTLTDSFAQLNSTDSLRFPSVIDHFKSILRTKIAQTMEADCLQQEIDSLTSQISQLKRENCKQ